MNYKPIKKEAKCTFQEFNKNKKELVDCSKPAISSAGRGFLCLEHIKHAVLYDSKACLFDKEDKPVISPENYIKVCKGETIKVSPMFNY